LFKAGQYRDAKQHNGLNDCQARTENKSHFQFNAALSAINIAKAVHLDKHTSRATKILLDE